jgi:hypothetical protein
LNQDIPEYSAEAYLAYSVLFGLEDFIIYIEDTKGLHIYESIFERLITDRTLYKNIQPVAGKTKLIETYNAYKDTEGNIPTIFIADMDFDIVLEKDMINDDNFIYLKRYSIENYLVDENVGVKFLNGRTSLGFKKCKEVLGFDAWLGQITDQYKRLLVIFATMHRLGIGERSCSLSPHRFISTNSWEINDLKVIEFLRNIVIQEYKRTKKYGLVGTYRWAEDKIQKCYKDEQWRLIPGKQLLKIFTLYLNDFYKGPHPVNEDFISFAAETCDTNELFFLKERILNYLSLKSTSKVIPAKTG